MSELNPSKLKYPGKPVEYAIHNHLLSEVTVPESVDLENYHIFSDEVKEQSITSQQSSGRCWLFAACNVIRAELIEKLNLPKDFEISQKHLFFWDQIEKANNFLNLCEKHKDDPLDGRKMMHYLTKPVEDGGQWQMAVSLINKYGIIPKSVCPDTKHVTATAGMRTVLRRKLREFCKQIRSGDYDKGDMLATIYKIMVDMFGKPPSKFTWKYKDKDGKFVSHVDIDPSFLASKVDLTKYVCLIHDPRNEFHKHYEVEGLQNVVGGVPVRHFNVHMNRLMECAKASIDDGYRVWFGCDVGKYFHREHGTMDRKIFDVEGALGIKFGLSKEDTLRYGDGNITHAMCITGYDISDCAHKKLKETPEYVVSAMSEIDRWQIENSWGKKYNEGKYAMSSDWFWDHTFQVVVDKKYLTKAESEDYDKGEVVVLPPWDPLGSLAC